MELFFQQLEFNKRFISLVINFFFKRKIEIEGLVASEVKMNIKTEMKENNKNLTEACKQFEKIHKLKNSSGDTFCKVVVV